MTEKSLKIDSEVAGEIKIPLNDNQHTLPNDNKGVLNRNPFSGTSDVQGSITKTIGSGEHAKDSFIWRTITWSFSIASTITLLIFVRSFFDIAEKEILLNSIVDIWNIFIPIITLALGYSFGKGK